jgi:anti-sigma regulatory factor (Ser/Thr protein kinase)
MCNRHDFYDFTNPVRVWGLTLPGYPEEVSRARRWARDILRDCPCADDAALIVSELGANAIVHTASGSAAGTFHIYLARTDHTLTIAVTDSGGTVSAPRAEHPGEDATHGRGLGVVTDLAADVRVHGDRRGRTITAELLIPLQ